MNEQEIANNLKQSIPQPEEPVLAPTPPPDTSSGQATTGLAYELDELTQYKLHDLFDEAYKPNDEVTKQRLSYIYQEVTKMVPESDYGFVAAKIRELQRIIGISDTNNRIYKLYQWLKLNNTRKNIEAEMGSVIYG